MLNSDFRSVPVLILGFSRIDSIRMMIGKLVNWGVRDVFLSLDFASDPKTLSEQQKLITELSSKTNYSGTRIRIWHRDRNHGVAIGVLSGLDWFFTENKTGIVIEDDLEFEEDFLRFCALALDCYKNHKDVLMVSGNRYSGQKVETSVTLTNYPQIWGWATWRSKWNEIRDLIIGKSKFQYSKMIRSNVGYFYAGATRARLGFVDTWDTPLAYEMLIRQKLCILPPVNLVSNIGSDVYAAHTRNDNFPMNQPIHKLLEVKCPSVESLNSTVLTQNKYLENNVFRIKKRHILSPTKLWFEYLPRKFRGEKMESLPLRLNRAEKFAD